MKIIIFDSKGVFDCVYILVKIKSSISLLKVFWSDKEMTHLSLKMSRSCAKSKIFYLHVDRNKAIENYFDLH